MRDIFALIVYIILQIVFIPFAIIGALIVAYKQLLVSKKLGVSQTAIEIINARWTMHVFNMREDNASAKLAPALPNTSTMGLWMALFPFYVRYKISGKYNIFPTIKDQGMETIGSMFNNRTVYFDKIIERYSKNYEQFVVLGAGLDTRCYGKLKNTGIECFELDQAANQQHKLKYMEKASIDFNHVKFIEVDFTNQDWFDLLSETSFDTNKKTIFLWEGVTLYLSEKSVRDTLNSIRTKSIKGTVIACDIYANAFVSGEYIKGGKASTNLLDLTDEGLGFGLEMKTDFDKTLKSFVESESLSIGETYFMGTNNEKGPFMVVAELIV